MIVIVAYMVQGSLYFGDTNELGIVANCIPIITADNAPLMSRVNIPKWVD